MHLSAKIFIHLTFISPHLALACPADTGMSRQASRAQLVRCCGPQVGTAVSLWARAWLSCLLEQAHHLSSTGTRVCGSCPSHQQVLLPSCHSIASDAVKHCSKNIKCRLFMIGEAMGTEPIFSSGLFRSKKFDVIF